MEDTRINPYNFNNKEISLEFVQHIINKYDVHETPRNLEIYQNAFIHKSYRKNDELIAEVGIVEKPEGAFDLFEKDYERLEFLGDSILGSVVSYYLYERYYNQNEGFLSIMKTKLVRKHALAFFSKELGFAEYIIMSRHMEDICNGRHSIDILEDVFEAFIGALYLDFEDKGHEVCRDFLINLIEEKVDFAELIMTDTNFKGKLTKYYMKMYQMKLTFKQIEKNGTIMKIGIYDTEGKLLEEGIGSNRKDAEQNACKELLIKMDML
jgi:ribonuclease-3